MLNKALIISDNSFLCIEFKKIVAELSSLEYSFDFAISPFSNSKEFDKNWIYKSYVMQWDYRVMKIENPESVITTPEDLNLYLESKKILE